MLKIYHHLRENNSGILLIQVSDLVLLFSTKLQQEGQGKQESGQQVKGKALELGKEMQKMWRVWTFPKELQKCH